ncbi:MAG: MerR family transcriptional regulator, partial [Micromonosporaceae bacterium]
IGGAFKEIQGSLAHMPVERGEQEQTPPADLDELAARRARRNVS